VTGPGAPSRPPERITIREVGPRDGLQPEAPVPVGARVELVEALVDAGVRVVEAAAFVSPKAVPQMAGAADVMAGIRREPGVRYVALVPNARGAELARAAGVEELSLTVSASEAYSQRNVRMSVEESLGQVAAVREVVGDGVPLDTVVSCAFGSPYEGEIDPAEVARLGRHALEAGSTSLTLADTTGMATPRRIEEVLAALQAEGAGRAAGPGGAGGAEGPGGGGGPDGSDGTGAVPAMAPEAIGLHLHDTRGTALTNAYAALQLGVRRFDTAVGGVGGSPFAEGAGGNLATEDLVHLCDDLGIATGIDLGALLQVSARLADLLGHPLPSRVAAAGPRTRRADPA
jgi:hydroxymethylglutaryl-CoA lyase